MTRIIHRQLIGHEDIARGHGKVLQERGGVELSFQQVEIEWIFRTVDEIKALNYNIYTHVAIHTIPEGPVVQYYYAPDSYATPDDNNVIKPNSVDISQPGRYIKVPGAVPAGSVFDTIIASASDEFTELTIGGPKTTFRAPYPLDMTNGYVRMSLTEAPVGDNLIVDLWMNGVTMFSTTLYIDDGTKTSVGAAIQSVISIPGMLVPDDAEFQVHVLQVGSSFAGTGLKVAVSGVKA